ncbi:hypothetical protein H0H93_016544 [Arthromyces matolae]|nr:hypothetical protein H0H93_016544 [Arthromyces matolae]
MIPNVSQTDFIAVVEWALALEAFIRLRLKEHRIVAIGHSAGTGAIMMSMRNFSPQNPPYIAVFLVEPAILSRELFNAHAREREESANLTMKMTLARRDSWSSKGAAAAYLKRRLPWKLWDPKVFDTYVNHGLHSIVTHDGETVGLKASKEQEAMAYPQFSPYIDSVELFRERCMVIPFHLIFGEKIDFMPRYIQDALIDPPRGLLPASATWVSNAGHLIVQENPTGLALAICDKLNGDIFQLKSRM